MAPVGSPPPALYRLSRTILIKDGATTEKDGKEGKKRDE